MPENNCGYKCYLNKVRQQNNCVIYTKSSTKNTTISTAGDYVNSLYCKKSCNNN